MSLFQPIFSTKPEPGRKPEQVLTLQEFIDLLLEEEKYWGDDQHNTKLIITRLRKIFYDQWGWNQELIRGAANIEGRYLITVVDDAADHSKPIHQYKNNEYVPKHRTVTYRPDDKIYGDTRVGQTPEIYKNDHQEVLLPDGSYCDVAHILAGLDAHNHPQVVSPLPNFLFFLNFMCPHVDSNSDIVTWLGDIASSSGDFLFDYLKNGKQPLSESGEEKDILKDAPGSDMLGNIESFVIAGKYNIGSDKGMSFTEILSDYYLRESGREHRNQRMRLYCEAIGLKGWDGEYFTNESPWLKYYHRQLRDNIAFQVMSLTAEKLSSIWYPLLIWFNFYRDVLKIDTLLNIYLDTLKVELKKELKL
ncbi:MAG: hypothetical protein HQ556_05690 [Candidatus Marinimicrobia bacterium]|nr:hypothetical protein [Candidatus Neomarinimicrobiota bacterium]